MRIDKYSLKCVLAALILFIISAPSYTQNSGEFIYANVTTKSNEQYEGFVRWGKEELAWHDVFNSVKVHQRYTKQTKKGLWEDFKWDIASIWEDKYRETDHTFACFFGDIKSITPKSSSKLDLKLKNGTVLKLEGGSNDVGATLQVFDRELGLVLIPWNKIKNIDFKQAQRYNKYPFGELLYGTVYTYKKGILEGYIKWDLDERAGLDVLDGYSGSKDVQINFADIKSIKRHEEGAYVATKNGEEIFLRGTNDVNSGNRGIAIYNHEVGRIELGWKEFKKVIFHPNNKRGPAYSDFEEPQGIHAQVLTYLDEDYDGMIVFDIDERWELELIDGDDDNIKYQIPFRNIKTIYPKNKTYSIIYLKNGDQLLLGERQDVSGNNDGLLLFIKSKDEPIHVDWSNIVEINIK